MRFHSSWIALLPALAAAAEDPLAQYKAQFQTFMDGMSSYIPNPGSYDPVAALAAKTGSMRLNVLTLENWKQTLYENVSPSATVPDDFWIFVTGGNKTCQGRCVRPERAFNETAGKFAVLPNSPRMGLLNCDNQPILCNTWSANPGNLWIFEMLPKPAAVDIYKTRLNSTTTTSEELVAIHERGDRKGLYLLDSWFHPLDGKAAELGLAVPLGYVIWAFSLVPQWAFMLIVSLLSRSLMGNRMGNNARGGAPAAAPQQAAR